MFTVYCAKYNPLTV